MEINTQDLLKHLESSATQEIVNYVRTNIYEDFLAKSHDKNKSFNIGVYQGILIATDLIKNHEKEHVRQERRNKSLEKK
tara:strand:+ start:183 stop:419 length:237 start_codon:yes stop_codon:yes gene_type:complete